MPLARHRRAELEEHLGQGRHAIGRSGRPARSVRSSTCTGPRAVRWNADEARVGHRQVVVEVDVRARQRGQISRAASGQPTGAPPSARTSTPRAAVPNAAHHGRRSEVDRGGVGTRLQTEEAGPRARRPARQRRERLARVLRRGRRKAAAIERNRRRAAGARSAVEQGSPARCRLRPEREVQMHAGDSSERAAGSRAGGARRRSPRPIGLGIRPVSRRRGAAAISGLRRGRPGPTERARGRGGAAARAKAPAPALTTLISPRRQKDRRAETRASRSSIPALDRRQRGP